MKTVTPENAKTLMNQGALLVDIRSAQEHAREHIPGSQHAPLETLETNGLPGETPTTVIFHCRSGNRTQLNAAMLDKCAGRASPDSVYILEGGLDAWKRAGLEVEIDRSQPMELQRQVQIGAGSLVLLGVILGAAVNHWFFALSAFVGAGLVFAGVTGFCGMARLLMKAPWNRRAVT